MSKPERIQRSRIFKQESPNGLPIIYVGRPSKWGNPYKVGDDKECGVLVKTREAVIEMYTAYAKMMTEKDPTWLDGLRDKNLSCWCGLDEKCHADILLELANQ